MVRAVIPLYRHARRPGRPTCIVNVLAYTPRVEPRGFEPRTSAVQGRRSPRLSYGPLLSPDSPTSTKEVGAPGFEPGTSALSGPRSNRLSYAPVKGVLSVRCMLFAHKSPCAEDEAKPTCTTVSTSMHTSLHMSDAPLPGSSLPCSDHNPRGRCHQPCFTVKCSTIGCMSRMRTRLPRKEVIQPQLPLRLPCYDFTPVMNPTVVSALLAVRLPTSGETHSHGVTGGVYKTRERIHRGVLIRDY